MRLLIIFALGVFLTGCAGQVQKTGTDKSMATSPEIIATEEAETPVANYMTAGEQLVSQVWQIIQIRQTPIPEDIIISVKFGENGSVTGFGGCNKYTGSYINERSVLAVGQMASTRRMCMDEQVMKLETVFYQAIAETKSFKITPEGMLMLITIDNEAIIAKALVPEEQPAQ